MRNRYIRKDRNTHNDIMYHKRLRYNEMRGRATTYYLADESGNYLYIGNDDYLIYQEGTIG